ncbi:hypothetical protein SMC26_16645 [Actinomadura fulvescens]|uniref:Cytochrome P450 n=1 Tax=Actinomadura fulvescens TaxID=46160 RepID=A0ABN3PL62_9ACTN
MTRPLLSDLGLSRELRYPGAPWLVKGTDAGEDPSALINTDPPRHTWLRRIASVAFTPRRVEDWRP